GGRRRTSLRLFRGCVPLPLRRGRGTRRGSGLKLQIARPLDVLYVRFPAVNLGGDQVLGDVVVDWNGRLLRHGDRLGLTHVLGTLVHVRRRRGLLHQLIVFGIGIAAVVLPAGTGLQQVEEVLRVVVVGDPAGTRHVAIIRLQLVVVARYLRIEQLGI